MIVKDIVVMMQKKEQQSWDHHVLNPNTCNRLLLKAQRPIAHILSLLGENDATVKFQAPYHIAIAPSSLMWITHICGSQTLVEVYENN